MKTPFSGTLSTHPYTVRSMLICDSSIPVAIVTPPPGFLHDSGPGSKRGLAEATTMLAAAPRLALALHSLLEVCELLMPGHIATDPDSNYVEVRDEAIAALAEAMTPDSCLG